MITRGSAFIDVPSTGAYLDIFPIGGKRRLGHSEWTETLEDSGFVGRRAFLSARALLRLLVAPGVGVDVEGVAVLSKAVDQSAETRGIVEHGAPLLVGKIGRQNYRSLFVSSTDDMKQQVSSATVARHIPELVQNQ